MPHPPAAAAPQDRPQWGLGKDAVRKDVHAERMREWGRQKARGMGGLTYPKLTQLTPRPASLRNNTHRSTAESLSAVKPEQDAHVELAAS